MLGTRDDLGWIALKQTGGGGGTQFGIPLKNTAPRNPSNNAYADVINNAAGPSVVTKGKKTPMIDIETLAHPTWFTQANLNALIGGSASFLDSNYYSYEFAVGMWEPVINTQRVYDGTRFSRLRVVYNAGGSDIAVALSGIARYGDSEAPAPTSFSAPATVGGQAYNTSDVAITGADQVTQVVMDLVRIQRFKPISDSTLFMGGTGSGRVFGTLTIVQEPTFGSTPSSTFSMQVGPATTGVKLSCGVNLDDVLRAFSTEDGKVGRTYSMVGFTGGYPFSIAAGT